MKRELVTLLLFLTLFSGYSQTIKAGFGSPEGSPVFIAVNRWVKELSRVTGLQFNLKGMSLEEAQRSLLNKTITLDIARSQDAYTLNKNVLRTSEPIMYLNLLFYTNRADIKEVTIESLRDLRVGHRSGAIYANRWLDKNKIKNIHYNIRDGIKGYELLKLNRIDIFIASDVHMISIGNDSGSIRVVPGPEVRIPIYIMLHRDNSYLEPLLSRGITKLLQSGVTREILYP